MDALKQAIAQEVYRALDETIQHRLARMEACADIEVNSITDLISQIKVWPHPTNSAPRYFTIQVKEVL